MRTENLPDNSTITFYGSIMELPAFLHSEYQCHLMQDSGIGSTMEDISEKYHSLMSFLAHGKIEEAREEMANLYYNHFSILNKISFKNRAFACLVAAFNGEPVQDYSDEGIKQIVSRIEASGITTGRIEEILNEVKKKSRLN